MSNFGIYSGTVIDNNDPKVKGRVVCKIPQVLGDSRSAWCAPVYPTVYKPPVNSVVWVMFINGDVTLPVYFSSEEITAEKIVANSITASEISPEFGKTLKISASQLTTGTLDATEEITVEGDAGAVRISGASGITLTPTGQTPSVVIPVSGTSPVTVQGTIRADTLEVSGGSTLRGLSSMEPAGSLYLQNAVNPPVSAPTVVLDNPVTRIDPDSRMSILGATMNVESGTSYIYRVGQDDAVFSLANVFTLVKSKLDGSNAISRSWSSGMPVGVAVMGSTVYVLVMPTSSFPGAQISGSLALLTYDLNLNPTGRVNFPDLTNSVYDVASGAALATDGTYLYVAYGKSPSATYVRQYVPGTWTLQGTYRTASGSASTYLPGPITGLYVGSGDWGSLKFVVGYDDANSTVRVWLPAAAGPPGSVMDLTSFLIYDWNNVKGYTTGPVWDGTNFWSFGRDGAKGLQGIKYSRNYWFGGESTKWWVTNTVTDGSHETAGGPRTSFTMRKRAYLNITWGRTPTGKSRLYLGRAATAPSETTLFKQGGDLTTNGSVLDNAVFTGTTLAGRGAAFAASTPANVYSQDFTQDTISTCTVTGNTVSNASNVFKAHYVGFPITDDSGRLPAGTVVSSVALDGKSVTVAPPASTSTTNGAAAITITLYKAVMRGDGSARFDQLYSNKLIATSGADVNTSSGNAPALRTGNIAASHLRIDGNEIQSMADDVTTGSLLLNQGGSPVFVGPGSHSIQTIRFDSVNVDTNASGIATIPHGCGDTPDFVLAGSRVMTAPTVVTVTNIGPTNFQVELRVSNTGALETSVTRSVSWIAIRR